MNLILEYYFNNLCCNNIQLIPLGITKGFLDLTSNPTDKPYLPIGLVDDGTNVVFPNIQRGYDFRVINSGTNSLNNVPIQLTGDSDYLVNTWAAQVSGTGNIVSWNPATRILIVNIPIGGSLDYSIRGEVTTNGGNISLGNNAGIVIGLMQPTTYPVNSGGRGYTGNTVNLTATSSIGSLSATVNGSMLRNMIFNKGSGSISSSITALGIDQTLTDQNRSMGINMIKLAGIYVYKASANDNDILPNSSYGDTVRKVADINNGLINNRLGTAVGSQYKITPITYPLSTNVGNASSLAIEVHTWYSLTGLENNYCQYYNKITSTLTSGNYQTNDTDTNGIDPYRYQNSTPNGMMFYDSSIIIDDII